MIRLALMAALAVAVLSPTSAAAQSRMSSEPITYTLRFPAPETHYVEVEATVPAGQPAIELMMAVWTPGSYLLREYQRHVEGSRRGAGRLPLRRAKSQKNAGGSGQGGGAWSPSRSRLRPRESVAPTGSNRASRS